MGNNDENDPFPKSDQIGPSVDAVLDAEQRAVPRYARQEPPRRRPRRINGHQKTPPAPWNQPPQPPHAALCDELLRDDLLRPHLTGWDLGFLASIADFTVLSDKQQAVLEKYRMRRDRLRLALGSRDGSVA